MTTRHLLPALLLCLSPFVATPATAAPANDELAALRAQVAALSARLAALEAQRAPAGVPEETLAAQVSQAVAAQADGRVQFKGDVRYRMEFIDQDGREERQRHRVRARLNATGVVTDGITAGLALATGSSDPTSTNQSLDGAFSTKGINLDQAWLRWAATDAVSISAGKFKTPFHRAGGNGLLWDGDLRPEGVALAYASGGLFLNLAGLWLEERSGESDSLLFGTQGGIGFAAAGGDLRLGAGLFAYQDVEGEAPLLGDAGNNRLDANGGLASDFNELELFVEWQTRVNDHNLSLFADWVRNLEADGQDTAWALGAAVKGKHRGRGWSLGWTWQDVDADAVYDLFNDSDFAGGDTDASGHILKGSYGILPGTSIGATLLLNSRAEDLGSNDDYNRLQLDLQVKF